MSGLPFSQACENNKQAILNVIKPLFTDRCLVLEIGSGTGQHGEFFAQMMPQLRWQLADRPEYQAGLALRCQHSGLANLLAPLCLDVDQPLPIEHADHVFSANTVHIMAWPQVQRLFSAVQSILLPGGYFCLYGPFNYEGQYTSASNADFDQWLQQRNPASAIRDFEAVCGLAEQAGLELQQDVSMPANNRCLLWRKPLQ